MRALYGMAVLATLLAPTAGHAQLPVSMRLPAPELTGVTEFINAKPFKLEDRRGKVVVLHFWAFG